MWLQQMKLLPLLVVAGGHHLHSLLRVVGKEAPEHQPQTILPAFQPVSTQCGGSAGAGLGAGQPWAFAPLGLQGR